MARPVTGKVMEDKIWVKQANGTWYCFERKRVWEDGKAKNLGKRLIGKADERGGELRPTRPKRKPAPKAADGQTAATRRHTGMCDILEFIGRVSGIDDDLRKVAGAGTADKIISLARYAAATDGATWPGVEAWMLTHPVPYEHPITQDVYLDLFRDIGLDESIPQGFFRARVAREDDPVLYVAYDSTTQTSETRNPEARVGPDKDRHGVPATRHLAMYSPRNRRPLAYAKRPGNVPDSLSIENGIKQLKVLTDKDIAVVTDGGFTSEPNLGAILRSKYHSLTRVKIGLKWVKAEIDQRLEQLRDVNRIMPSNRGTKGLTVTLTREFPYKRVYGSKTKGPEAGDTDHFRRRVYLHIYYDSARRDREEQEFLDDVWDVKEKIEKGVPLDRHAETVRDRYLTVKRRGKKAAVTVREDKTTEACRYFGMFALVSDYFEDADEALVVYRKREWVEDYFERFKQGCDGKATRTGGADSLAGRMFVQFVAMCYIEEIHNRIRDMKGELGVPNGDAAHDTQTSLDAELELKNWLQKRSMHNILLWFDAYETFEVSTDITKRMWGTESTARDRLFLNTLGMVGAKG